MPAGVSWATYLKHLSVAMIFMMAGAQTVHLLYRPLEDLDEIIEKEKERKNVGSKTETTLKSETS